MLTIFTPTYNRGYILPRLYNSLRLQSCKNFEWVIVDDGSTDNTYELVQNWITQNKIKIRYYQQPNQGKPMAHNLGVKKAEGKLFTCVDSDDYLTLDAVEIISKKEKELDEIDNVTGFVGMRVLQNKKPVGTYMPEKIQYSTLADLYNKYNYRGDTILVYRTDIIKKYEFPQIDGEKFIPETYLYDKIDQEGKLAVIHEGIYVCEYLKDGYTNNVKKLIMNNPKGYKLCAEQKLIFERDFKQKYIAATKYVLGSLLAKEKKYISKSPKIFLTLLAIPCAYIIYLKKYKFLGE